MLVHNTCVRLSHSVPSQDSQPTSGCYPSFLSAVTGLRATNIVIDFCSSLLDFVGNILIDLLCALVLDRSHHALNFGSGFDPI
mmetsp:Transcript_10395/g.16964  ORF Transcript_10395/g.16964 Transcript_10395/m.16964 type:complete len:83 (-) Transcript_10395:495-743(-)